MENIILSINVVLPLFLTISLGYLSKQINLIDGHTLKVMNKITFKIFLPVLLFYNIYKTDLSNIISAKLFVFSFVSLTLLCFILCLIIPFVEKDNRKRGVLVQALFRSNFILFALPVLASLFGENQIGVPTLMLALVVPLINFLAVICLEIFRGEKLNYKRMVVGIITNPLIIASTIGLILLALGMKLPTVIEKTTSDLARIATPLALFILGGTFKFEGIKGYTKQLLIAIIGSLVVIPAIFVVIAISLGFQGIELATIMIMFAAPTAVSSFTMAEQMGADGDLAGRIVVLTTAFSIFTIFFWVFLLKQFALI